MDANRLRQLLELAKTRLKESKEDDNDALTLGLDKLAASSAGVHSVSMAGTGLPDEPKTDEEVEATTDFLTTVASVGVNELAGPTKRDVGVTRDVSLNTKQQLFMDTMLSGEDVVLIGAAGTGRQLVLVKQLLLSSRQASAVRYQVELNTYTKEYSASSLPHSLGRLLTIFVGLFPKQSSLTFSLYIRF